MSQIVAITGASGFVGAHIVREALAKGYGVRSIVRSADKGQQLQRDFANKNHSIAYVSDIRNVDELKLAFEGATFIQHVASPYHTSFSDPRADMLDPAIGGTLAVMEAAMATPSVKHLLLTSSFAAINCLEKGGSLRDYTYTEDDWNPATYEGAATHENKVYTYCASKALAEKWYVLRSSKLTDSAWEFWTKEHPQFALTTFCPPGIVGPIVHPLASLDELNTSCANVWRLVSGETNGNVPLTLLPQTVDVRDVATAHVNAMECEAAKGKRFILCGNYIDLQLVVDYLRGKFPDHCDTIPVGNTGVRNQPGPIAKLDSSHAEKVLGMVWTPWQKTYQDLVTQLWDLHAHDLSSK